MDSDQIRQNLMLLIKWLNMKKNKKIKKNNQIIKYFFFFF